MNRDPGLQAERTQLAWLRTALVLMANALLVIRAGANGQDLALLSGGAVMAFSGFAFVAIGHLRGRQIAASPLSMTQLQMGTVSASVLVASACALALLIRC